MAQDTLRQSPSGRVLTIDAVAFQSFTASELMLVSSYDTAWQVNTQAPKALSTDDAIIPVIVFDDDVETGIGLMLYITESINMVLLTRPRAFSASDTASFEVYARTVSDGAPGAWALVGSATQQYDDGTWAQTGVILDLSAYAEKTIQLELVRTNDGASLGGVEVSQVLLG